MGAYLVLLRVEFTVPRTVASRAVRSYRTLSPLPDPLRAIGGLLSVALVVGSRPPGVTWHPALWSPDFPPPAYAGSDCLGQLTARIIRQFVVQASKSFPACNWRAFSLTIQPFTK